MLKDRKANAATEVTAEIVVAVAATEVTAVAVEIAETVATVVVHAMVATVAIVAHALQDRKNNALKNQCSTANKHIIQNKKSRLIYETAFLFFSPPFITKTLVKVVILTDRS